MKKTMIVGGIAITALSFTGLVAATVASADAPDSFNSLYAKVGAQRDTPDQLPALLLASDSSTDLEIQTSHLIGESDRATYWSVLREDGALCLVVKSAFDPNSIGGTCSNATEFAAHGMLLTVENPENTSDSFATYLVPDTALTDSSAALPDALNSPAPGILEMALADSPTTSEMYVGGIKLRVPEPSNG